VYVESKYVDESTGEIKHEDMRTVLGLAFKHGMISIVKHGIGRLVPYFVKGQITNYISASMAQSMAFYIDSANEFIGTRWAMQYLLGNNTAVFITESATSMVGWGGNEVGRLAATSFVDGCCCWRLPIVPEVFSGTVAAGQAVGGAAYNLGAFMKVNQPIYNALSPTGAGIRDMVRTASEPFIPVARKLQPAWDTLRYVSGELVRDKCKSIFGPTRFEQLKRRIEQEQKETERKQKQGYRRLLLLHGARQLLGGQSASDVPSAVLARRADLVAGLAPTETLEEWLSEQAGVINEAQRTGWMYQLTKTPRQIVMRGAYSMGLSLYENMGYVARDMVGAGLISMLLNPNLLLRSDANARIAYLCGMFGFGSGAGPDQSPNLGAASAGKPSTWFKAPIQTAQGAAQGAVNAVASAARAAAAEMQLNDIILEKQY